MNDDHDSHDLPNENSTASALPDHAADVRALRAASNAAIAACDADRVVSFMDAGIVVVVAGGAVLDSIEANRCAFATQMRDPAFGGYLRTPSAIEIQHAPLRANEQGRWVGRWRVRRSFHEQRGTYTAEWQMTALGWRIVTETFSSE
jgi:ketosteroid isomerase-like protein